MSRKENIQLVYIGQRANGRHAYLIGQSSDPIYFKGALSKQHKVGAIYEATRQENGEKGWSYRAESEPCGSWTDREQVAEWVHQSENAKEHARILSAMKKMETMARKCITPDLRRAWRNSGEQGRHQIVVALIESLEKRS